MPADRIPVTPSMPRADRQQIHLRLVQALLTLLNPSTRHNPLSSSEVFRGTVLDFGLQRCSTNFAGSSLDNFGLLGRLVCADSGAHILVAPAYGAARPYGLIGSTRRSAPPCTLSSDV